MPSTRLPSATASGVPPASAMRCASCAQLRSGTWPPQRLDVRDAPRRRRPCGSARRSPPFGRSQPLMRVCAVKGMKCAPSSWMLRPRRPCCSLTSTTIERPSGVSSARLASCAASASSSSRTPSAGRSSVAMRLPSVMVPVLSSSSTSTSPAASTARPLMAITFLRSRRSMPAMPMAESRPPMVVGIRQTSSATIVVADSRMLGVERQRHQRHAGEQEDDREPDEQDVQRDLVRRLLPRRALDERDHAVEERLARDRR